MPAYDANRPEQSRINFFDLAGRTINLFEPEPLNAIGSIDDYLLEAEEPLEACFWDEPQSVSPWNSYWTEAAKYGGGLKIDDPVFKNFWTKYYGLHVDCQDEEVCDCEHNCGGTHTTKGRAVTDSEVPAVKPKDWTLYPGSSVFTWANYAERKLDKGKAVDREQHPAPPPTPLIIITRTDGHEIVVW